MTIPDHTLAARLAKLDQLASAGKWGQFHPDYMPEAVGAEYENWDISHGMSAVSDGNRKRLSTWTHARDAQFAETLINAHRSDQLITRSEAEAMVRAAENRGLLKAVEIIDANVSPCVPPTTWTDEELEGYSNGQIDAAASFMDAIRARVMK